MDSSSRETGDSSQNSREGLLSEYPEKNNVCQECCSRWSDSRRRKSELPLLLIPVVLLALAMLIFYLLMKSDRCTPRGYWEPTEFGAVKREIPAETLEVRFTAGLLYNEHRELYRPTAPGRPEYVGTPTPELDAAWEELFGAVNVFVTKEEEPSLGGGLYLEPDSDLYMAEITVMHDLHCLNMIRQSLPFYWDYYKHNNDSVLKPHLDHCIDSLRLSLMCHGDMTFSPIIWSHNGGRIIPNFEVVHTCRNYDALKQWANDRDSSDPNRWPKNAARLHAEWH